MTYIDEPDSVRYWTCNTIRRVVKDKDIEIHKLCVMCDEWYDTRDISQVGKYKVCRNCWSDFPEYLKNIDEDLYKTMNMYGVLR